MKTKELFGMSMGLYGRYRTSKSVCGIFRATTKGLDGKDIHAFYKNGALFIVNWSDARDYFNSSNCSPGNQSRDRAGITVSRDERYAKNADKNG